MDAVGKDAAFAAAKETGIEPTEIKVVKLALPKPALKRYRVVCDIDASAIAILDLATCGGGLPIHILCRARH